MSDFRRREFMALLGGATAAWPFAARAQQRPTMPVVGILGGHTGAEWTPFVAAFNVGLKEIGFVEGQNVRIEYRWAEGHYDRRLSWLSISRLQRRSGSKCDCRTALIDSSWRGAASPLLEAIGVDCRGTARHPFVQSALLLGHGPDAWHSFGHGTPRTAPRLSGHRLWHQGGERNGDRGLVHPC
jgi:hypothetical protein